MTESCNCADKIAALQLEAGLVEGYRLTQAELWAENGRLRDALKQIACTIAKPDLYRTVALHALGRSSDPTEETCN